MEIEFESAMWFDVEEHKNCWKIGTETSCGNYVSIRVRKKNPYKKHWKNLAEQINKLKEAML